MDLCDGIHGVLFLFQGPVIVVSILVTTQTKGRIMDMESDLLPSRHVGMRELLDIIEEAGDRETSALVAEGRRAVRSGAKGVPVFIRASQ